MVSWDIIGLDTVDKGDTTTKMSLGRPNAGLEVAVDDGDPVEYNFIPDALRTCGNKDALDSADGGSPVIRSNLALLRAGDEFRFSKVALCKLSVDVML